MAQLEVNPAVVVGAGPYGLAVAARLRARRVPVRVFGDVLDSWAHEMPAGMCAPRLDPHLGCTVPGRHFPGLATGAGLRAPSSAAK